MRALLIAAIVASAATARAEIKIDYVMPKHPHAGPKANVLTGLTLYLNRCTNNCNVHPGGNDATTDNSDIATMAASLSEHAWMTGEWEGIVQCVKEVYSPYNILVTDVRPTDGVYNEVIVAGSAAEIGASAGSCGVGEFSVTPCEPTTDAVAFTFTEGGCHEDFAMEDPDPNGATTGIYGTCWVIAQETAHSFSLDHEYQFRDSGQSACNDPMTYRSDCGGQKFFRNEYATCGEFTASSVHLCGGTCGDVQNSHARLLEILGPGTPITKPPTIALMSPADGATIMAGSTAIGTASAQRGIATVELWLNGYKWASTPGVAFGAQGQPEAPYLVTVPANVPDSKYDLVLKAFDDIGVEGDTATISVVKGKASGCDPTVTNPDGTIDTCLKGQQCTAGKCAWQDAGMGQFGDACTYDQFCSNDLECTGTATDTICTHDCDLTIADSCPVDYQCIPSGGSGVCFFPEKASGGGCCSADTGLAGPGCLAFVTFVAIGRRRRRIG